MKLFNFLTVLAFSSLRIVQGSDLHRRATLKGIDVSHYQPNVNFAALKADGVYFAYIKATEGTTYKDPTFSEKYIGATNAGVIRGGYHFARPASSSGANQATFFVANGGGWSGDGRTLPGALDLEAPPSGARCYGLSTAAMVSWIRSFSDTYARATGRPPAIYTTTSWWVECTGNSAAFSDNPLWIARWSSSIGTLPASWSFASFWQYSDSGEHPGDQNYFLGDESQLKRFATG